MTVPSQPQSESAERGWPNPEPSPEERSPVGPERSEPGIATEVSTSLSTLADLPVEEHPEVFEAVHRRLGDTLSGIDHV